MWRTGTALADDLARWEALRRADVLAYRALMRDPMHVKPLGNLLWGLDLCRTFAAPLRADVAPQVRPGLQLQQRVDELAGYASAPAVSFTGVSGSGSGVRASALLATLILANTSNQIGGAGDMLIAAVVTNNGATNGTFPKIGSGSLTLSGANTYTGPTVVTNGTLSAVNTTGSATGSGNVTVTNGAALAGSGFIVPTGASGNLASLSAGAHLSPHVGSGASNATLHITVSSSSATNALYIAGGTVVFLR